MKQNCSLANIFAAVCAAPYGAIFSNLMTLLFGIAILVTIGAAIALTAYFHDFLIGKAWDLHLTEALPILIGVVACVVGVIGYGLRVDFKGTLKLVLYTASFAASLAAFFAYLDWAQAVVGSPLGVNIWTASVPGELFWALLPARILFGVFLALLAGLNVFCLYKAASWALRSMCDFGARARASKAAV